MYTLCVNASYAIILKYFALVEKCLQPLFFSFYLLS